MDGDQLQIDLLDPSFVLATFFADTPLEATTSMSVMVESVRDDIILMTQAAVDATLAQ